MEEHLKKLKFEDLCEVVEHKKIVLTSEGLKKTRHVLENGHFTSSKDIVRDFSLATFKKTLRFFQNQKEFGAKTYRVTDHYG